MSEEIFVQATIPDLIVENNIKYKSISCFYDKTPQGENALKTATELSKHLHIPLHIYTVSDLYLTFKELVTDIRGKSEELIKFTSDFTKENEVASNTELIIGGRIQKIIELFEEELLEEEKLSYLMRNKLKEKNDSIVVVGSPMLRLDPDKGHFGFYLTKLLEDPEIHSNFVIVPDIIKERENKIVCFLDYEQDASSIVTLLNHAFGLSGNETEIHLIGIISEKLVDTVARSEPTENDDETVYLAAIQNRLVKKFDDLLSSIKFNMNEDTSNFHYDIKVGIPTNIIKESLNSLKPWLTIVRNVAIPGMNLDSLAQQIATLILIDDYPVYLVWD